MQKWLAVLVILFIAKLSVAGAGKNNVPVHEQIYVHTDKEFYMPGEIIWFKIYVVDQSSLKPLNMSQVAYVALLDGDDVSVLQAKIELGKTNSGSFFIPHHVSTGNYRFVAYTNLMRNLHPSHFFTKYLALLNPFEPLPKKEGVRLGQPQDTHSNFRSTASHGLQLIAEISETQVATRSPVSLSVLATVNGIPVSPDLSVAVYKIDRLQGIPSTHIASVLRHPEQGHVDSIPRAYRDPNHHFVEYRSHQIAIRYTDKHTKQPMSGKAAWLSFPGKQDKLYVNDTDEYGIARFNVRGAYGTQQLATALASGVESTVEWLSPFDVGYPGGMTVLNDGDYDYSSLQQEIASHSLHVQVQNEYQAAERTQFYRPEVDTLPFFGKADRTYWLDDYTRFIIMEEVLREYVMEVSVRKRREGFNLRVLDRANGHYFSSDPLILLDGVPLASADEIMAYDPLNIQKIDVITGAYFYGSKRHEGIVSFHTYEGTLAEFTLHPSITLLPYEGLQDERAFYTPQYDSMQQRNSRMPDTRNVLLWVPAVRWDHIGKAQLAITTSDLKGSFVVVVQGIDEQGNRGSVMGYFDVN